MTKQTRHKVLGPLHRLLATLAAACSWFAGALERMSGALSRASAACDPARGAADTVELRDALTGEPLGLTKAQYRRYMLALGSDNPRAIAKAHQEVQERRRSVLGAWAGLTCLALSWGCTKGNDGLRLCTPGQQQECACPGGQKGAQACLQDGSGFAECLGCAGEATDMATSLAALDLAGADFAQPDLQGADFAGAPVPDLANPAFTGISCGTSTCGPVGGNLGCCAQVTSGSSTLACYADTGLCPPSFQATSFCDGPEDCTGGTKCRHDLSIDKTTGEVTSSEDACSTPGSFTVRVVIGAQNMTINSVACHSADDCVGVSGNVPTLGNVPFDSCCHYNGYPRTFCANKAASGSPIVCP